MVYYPYPPPYNGAADQPYYYHNGMCYSNGTAAAAHVSHQKDITNGHTSSGKLKEKALDSHYALFNIAF